MYPRVSMETLNVACILIQSYRMEYDINFFPNPFLYTMCLIQRCCSLLNRITNKSHNRTNFVNKYDDISNVLQNKSPWFSTKEMLMDLRL